jgi:hypothetical protein
MKLVDKIGGYLQVGITPDTHEVIINLDHERNGIGHIVFSPNQARTLAYLLLRKANDIDPAPAATEHTLAEENAS